MDFLQAKITLNLITDEPEDHKIAAMTGFRNDMKAD